LGKLGNISGKDAVKAFEKAGFREAKSAVIAFSPSQASAQT
jgi:hypothetical protein